MQKKFNKIVDISQILRIQAWLGVVAYAFNSSPWEAEVEPGGSLWVQGQSDLYRELQSSQNYIDKQTKNTHMYVRSYVF